MPWDAYEVRLSNEGRLFRIERTEGKDLRHEIEPGTSLWCRGVVRFLSVLPIEWLL